MINYFPGVEYLCPRCNSNLIHFFFDMKCRGWFEAMKWIKSKKAILSDSIKEYEKNPTAAKWICKNCYDGGIVQKQP